MFFSESYGHIPFTEREDLGAFLVLVAIGELVMLLPIFLTKTVRVDSV